MGRLEYELTDDDYLAFNQHAALCVKGARELLALTTDFDSLSRLAAATMEPLSTIATKAAMASVFIIVRPIRTAVPPLAG